jgi:murein DD-endopeptidase MepM/ murein hydrolase activator NlpD
VKPARRSAARLAAESGTRPAPAGRTKAARAQRPAARREAPVRAPRTAGATFRRNTKRVTVVGAMLFAGSMLVATSVPANAFFVDTPTQTAAKKAADSQSYTAAAPSADGAAGISRDGYSVTEMKAVSEYASTSASTFSNDVNGTVQWPFQTGVPISSGFGARQVANCGFCSTFHQGLDFVPGAGSPIQSIADGVVSKVDGPSGALGNNVWIDHVVNGQKVTSVYAHMQTGSVEVREGETVTVGTIIGKVGSTGNSTGAHLHFEIVIGGVPVDPYPWLQANTN